MPPGSWRGRPYFNSRPRAGGDHTLRTRGAHLHHFNSRPRAGGDLFGERKNRTIDISIHAPAQGATAIFAAPRLEVLFQFTPPRRGRHTAAQKAAGHRHISIHAPAQGATADRGGDEMSGLISIHAPAQGATDRKSSCERIVLFQFTPPRRGRRSARALRSAAC